MHDGDDDIHAGFYVRVYENVSLDAHAKPRNAEILFAVGFAYRLPYFRKEINYINYTRKRHFCQISKDFLDA